MGRDICCWLIMELKWNKATVGAIRSLIFARPSDSQAESSMNMWQI